MTTNTTQTIYKKSRTLLQEQFGYKSVMAVPRVTKVVLNTSFGKMGSGKTPEEQRKMGETIGEDLSLIAGQKPFLTRAKKSIATFKLREGAPVGLKVTLRGQKMYDFLDRLINVVFPRSRDFRGLERTSVDRNGNLNIGIKEHLFFPEISPEKSKISFGLEVTVQTSAANQKEGLALFQALGFPFAE